MLSKIDRVGLGWRADLAAEILTHQSQIDLVEVIADDFFEAPTRRVRALKTLSSRIPIVLHGVGLGLASCQPVEQKLLAKMARLVDQIRPEFWSEHLAFVRSHDVEIGHLAAPPRTSDNVEGTADNLFRAWKVIGSKPLMENIATLVNPPGSTLEESVWISNILRSSDCDLLFDLHNVFANGANHDYDPKEFIHRIPAPRIRSIHIAGGRLVHAPNGTRTILDDHLHDVPEPVFELLEEVAAVSPNPLTVILERDGAYPSMGELLTQIKKARRALARGRARRSVPLEMTL